MTLKIEQISGKRRTRIRLSGELRCQDIDQVKAEIVRSSPRLVLDLEEVDLVDLEGVRFLNLCYAEGIGLSPLLALHQEMDAPRACSPQKSSKRGGTETKRRRQRD